MYKGRNFERKTKNNNSWSKKELFLLPEVKKLLNDKTITKNSTKDVIRDNLIGSSSSRGSPNKCTKVTCDKDKICNPPTGRCVLKNGKLGKGLAKKSPTTKKSPKEKKSPTTMKSPKSCDKITNGTFTITFGERVENHARMQMIGELGESGYSIKELKEAQEKFDKAGATTEYVDLKKLLPKDVRDSADEAGILVIRKGAEFILGHSPDKLLNEMVSLECDKKALMRGRVVNKKARWNACFADFNQPPDYASGKGTVVDFKELPELKKARKNLPKFFGKKSKGLLGELNHYYDVDECYIQMHGDSERRIVIAFRLGEDFKMFFQWHLRFEAVGKRKEIKLHHGDVYIFSEKAAGTDWKTSSKYTLRHAAAKDFSILQKLIEKKPKKKGKSSNNTSKSTKKSHDSGKY